MIVVDGDGGSLSLAVNEFAGLRVVGDQLSAVARSVGILGTEFVKEQVAMMKNVARGKVATERRNKSGLKSKVAPDSEHAENKNVMSGW